MYLKAEIPDVMEIEAPAMTYEERVLASFPSGFYLVPLIMCSRCHEESELFEDGSAGRNASPLCGACKAYLNV